MFHFPAVHKRGRWDPSGTDFRSDSSINFHDSFSGNRVANININQWPFQEPKLEVPTIYKAYVRRYTPKIWPYMVLTYLHLRILEIPRWISTLPDLHMNCHGCCHNTQQTETEGKHEKNSEIQWNTMDFTKKKSIKWAKKCWWKISLDIHKT